MSLEAETANEVAKNEKSINDSAKQHVDATATVTNSQTTSLKSQSRSHSTASPNNVDSMNSLNNPYYNSVGMPIHSHHPHHHHSHNPHHILPPAGYPIAHSSHHPHHHPQIHRHPNYPGAYPIEYYDPHYMNGAEPYYPEGYPNENFYEPGKRNKSSSYYKSSSQYKETEFELFFICNLTLKFKFN